MGDDDKSWRDIDRQRDKSSHVRDDTDKPSRHDARSDSKYKQDLEKLFQSGGDNIPDRFQHVMEELGPEPGTEEAARKEAIDDMREADGFQEFAKQVNVYVEKGYRFPDDVDLLIRMLDHPDNDIVVRALIHIVDLSQRRDIERTDPIQSRLKTLRTMTHDAELLDLVERVESVVLDD